MRDLRFALRLLLKAPAFTFTVLVTLAVCIGANTAMFSIVRSVVLKPLPVPNAERIVVFHNEYPNAGAPSVGTSVPHYFDRRTEIDSLETAAVYRRGGTALNSGAGARQVATLYATPSFFDLVSARPVLGRVFTEEEGLEGAERVVVLSYAFWQREFGGQSDVVGRDLRLDGTLFQVVGVLPRDFSFLWNDLDVFIPASFSAEDRSDERRHSNDWNMLAVLGSGTTVQQLQQEVDALNRRNEVRFPELTQILHDAGFRTSVSLLQEEITREVRPVLMLLWGGVLFVLVIGCLNVASLVLIRASGRAREMATRHAVGASHWLLARQLLAETTVLSVVGGALGVLLGWWLLRLVPVLNLDRVPRGFEIGLDPAGVAIVLSVSLIIGLFIGLLPVVRLWRINVNATLREESRGGTSSRKTNLVRRSLATAQIALAFVLLIGAGLLLSSFRALLAVDPGFEPGGIFTGALNLPGSAYEDDAVVPFVDRLMGAVRSVPGVEGASVSTSLPLSGQNNDSVVLAEGQPHTAGESLVSPLQIRVGDGYFETMKIGLVRGRTFDARDTASAPPVVVVDERLAEHFWPGGDPIGRRIYQPRDPAHALNPDDDTTWITVVGVVSDVAIRQLAADEASVGAYYFPFAQSPRRSFSLIARSSVPPELLQVSLERTLASLDPRLPLSAVRTMQTYYDDALSPRRTPMVIAAAFGGVALFLAGLGVYGVLAFSVAERRREIGIRVALGSTSGGVFWLVLRGGLYIVFAGIALGLAGLALLRPVMGAALFGVQSIDPRVIAVVAAGLAVVALFAIALPAWRAAAVNPASVLAE